MWVCELTNRLTVRILCHACNLIYYYSCLDCVSDLVVKILNKTKNSVFETTESLMQRSFHTDFAYLLLNGKKKIGF